MVVRWIRGGGGNACVYVYIVAKKNVNKNLHRSASLIPHLHPRSSTALISSGATPSSSNAAILLRFFTFILIYSTSFTAPSLFKLPLSRPMSISIFIPRHVDSTKGCINVFYINLGPTSFSASAIDSSTASTGAFANIDAGYTEDPHLGCNITLQHPAF